MSAAPEWRLEEPDDREAKRAAQEREVALRHALVEAELVLALEAVLVGRALRQVGLGFDPLTFVALRILEASADADPLDVLSWLIADGTVERSVAVACERLGEPDGE